MTRIEPLSLPAPDFAWFTYPRYRPLLDGSGTETAVEAVGAYLDDVPVGLALLRHDRSGGDTPNKTRLLSIMVAKPFRRTGIGRALLDASAVMARNAGSQTLATYHSDRTRNREAFEGLLSASGWMSPEMAEFRIAGHADWTEKAKPLWEPMLRRFADHGYSTEPWENVSAEDRDRADTLVPSGGRFNYRLFEHHCDLGISIALRQRGQLVGWIFGEHREGDDHCH